MKYNGTTMLSKQTSKIFEVMFLLSETFPIVIDHFQNLEFSLKILTFGGLDWSIQAGESAESDLRVTQKAWIMPARE